MDAEQAQTVNLPEVCFFLMGDQHLCNRGAELSYC
jgi:hypothetical protein